MRTQAIITTALCALLGAPQIIAQEAPQQVQEVQQAIQAGAHPFFDKGMYPDWSRLTPAQARIDSAAAMVMARHRLDIISNIKPEEASFENTFLALSHAQDELEKVQNRIYHLKTVADSEELRKVQEELMPQWNALAAEVLANDKLWTVLRKAATQAWVRELSPAKRRYVEQVIQNFHDQGADLEPEHKARKKEIEDEMSLLELEFGKNVQDSTEAWELIITDPEQLAGMSADWMDKAREDAKKHVYGADAAPAWRISLQAASYGEVLKHCTVEATRRKCWEGFLTIGSGKYDNEPIVARIMELRRELAELLGFETFADLTTHRRMVGSGQNALKFVDDMMQKVKPAFDAECTRLLDFVARRTGKPTTALNPWDRSFYLREMSEEVYNFDAESVRPYLKSENVVNGIFSIFSNLYGVSFTELPSRCLKPGEKGSDAVIETWHPEVKVFAVTDDRSGTHLGTFYMDLYPRNMKREGAWVMPLGYGEPRVGDKPHTPHLACLVGNMTAATSDKPALFSHRDAVVLFHEFGHMMHVMLSDTELQAHSGTGVAWDFVELPSQITENWAWEPEGIATFGFHYATGESMPDELVDKLRSSRYFLPATDNMGQLCIAKLDLEMHMFYNEKFQGKGLDAATRTLLRDWQIQTTVPGTSIMRRLRHCITGGYSAGYYSYKWAEVLAADAYSRFRNEGVMNRQTGDDFRRFILSQGDSQPAADLYRQFMGRNPDPDALLQTQGLCK
ncbi:MAG: M3 family metallopeptidase [Akkermansia sp.]|nr:M3 family metallopeptidase [Akkermansia sp.]